MGLHRDGQEWGLHDLEMRRLLFWEVFCSETFTSKSWGRPPALTLKDTDTKFPSNAIYEDEWTYQSDLHRFKLGVIICKIMERPAGESTRNWPEAKTLWDELMEYDRSTPFELRCRASL